MSYLLPIQANERKDYLQDFKMTFFKYCAKYGFKQIWQ